MDLLLFILVGFFAQIIDGALGMAYGVSSTTFLLSTGVTPAIASASVHIAEIFTTFVSGISHFKFGNVDKSLFKKLVIPGVIGGAVGAYVLTSVPGNKIAPFVSIYLLVMGIRILYKAYRNSVETKSFDYKKVPFLAFIGGCFNAIGGGGWGPIVTTTLISNGHCPRKSIGTVNASEFFVTIAEVIVFLSVLKIQNLEVVLGLIIGGIIGAPLAAYVCKKIPTKALMAIVGILIMLLSIRNILLAVL
ncbi:MAG: sulfite exporter TauE/SafE family protein [Tissierellia bacterium]|nr:sulfite exporter TauE/SafE family protein [Tissierellia bacterium]